MPEQETVVEQKAESAAQASETEQAAASAAAAQQETPTDQSAEEQAKPPEKGGVQRRIDELTKARRLAEAEAEFWRQKALGEAASKQPAVEKPKNKPNPADFETTEAYLDARDVWVREETLRTTREEIQKTEQERERRTEQEILANDWGEKEASTTEKHPDYEEITATAFETLQSAKGQAQAAIAHVVQYSEVGPELLYYLGQHPEEVRRIVALHPTQAALALGRIEGRLIQETESGEEKTPLASRAPKPPVPLKNKGAVAPAFNPLDPSSYPDYATYEREMNKREAARAKGG